MEFWQKKGFSFSQYAYFNDDVKKQNLRKKNFFLQNKIFSVHLFAWVVYFLLQTFTWRNTENSYDGNLFLSFIIILSYFLWGRIFNL